MTRGRIYLIDAHKRWIASMQFNSDMYIEPIEFGHGAEIVSAFRRGMIFDEQSLSEFISDIVPDWYSKMSVEIYNVFDAEFLYSDSIVIDGISDDYSYIMNCSGEESEIRINGSTVNVDKDEVVILHFDRIYGRYRKYEESTRFELSEDETALIIDALEFYIRMHLGQYDFIDSILLWKFQTNNDFRKNEYTRRMLLSAMRSRIFYGSGIENWDITASLGIWSDKTNIKAVNAYDIMQVMRHTISWYRNPQGGNTVNFDKPIIKGELKELECRCFSRRDKVIEEIILKNEHVELLEETMKVYEYMLKYDTVDLFRCYTNDKINLSIAKILKGLYTDCTVNDEAISKLLKIHKRLILET